MAGEVSVEETTPGILPPSALLTFLIVDVRGYTRFTVEHGDIAAARLAEAFATIARDVAAAHSGDVIELRGDEALAVFGSARSALHAALALQRRFAEAAADDPAMPLRVGIGLDAGEAIPVQGGYRGAALNLAARLCSIAGAGEVFASETVVSLARKTDGVSFVDRGEVTLKGFASPIRVIQVAPEGELPDELPPLQPVLVTHPTNLPDEPTPFIGREGEIQQIVGLLRDPHVRMVTLTGPGGTGKTRLALQVGSTVLHDFRHGVFFVDLAPVTDPALVPATVARALGVNEEAGKDLLETLVAWLQEKELLLVLDNYEHLVDAASVVATLLDRCRELHVLVTSRVPLHLSREHEHSVPPLAVPDPAHLPDLETLSQYESVALFIERARATRDSFSVTNENAPAVAEICSRLDGLPLAIELAAARIKLFPPQALLQRLDSRLRLLTGGARDRPTRQQTLRGAIDWSYSLLTREEQALFARLSVFAGGWSFEAAEAVCTPDATLDLLEGMASLVDKSLLRQQGEHEPRFSMLETIREYAADKLDERGECETMRDAHAGYFLALAEEARPSLDQQVGEEWLDRFARERDNARVAFRRLLDSGRDEEAGRLAVALWGFWRSSRGSWIEGKRQLEEVVTRPGLSAGTRAWALARLCNYLSHGGEVDRLERTAREVVTLAQQIGDPVVEFDGVVYLWSAANRRGNQDGADALYEACLELAPRTHDLQAMTQVIRMQGFHAVQHGDLDRAAELFAEEVALRRDPEVAGDLWGALINVGWVALQRGDLDTAEAAYSERGHLPARQGLAAVALARGQYDDALRRCAEVAPAALQERTIPLLAESLLGIAQIAAVQGRPALTALLVGATDAARAELGFALDQLPGEQERLDLAHAALDEQAWTAEYERGRRLTLEDATQIALQFAGESGGPGSRW